MFGTGQEPLVPCPALLCHTTRYLEERREKTEKRLLKWGFCLVSSRSLRCRLCLAAGEVSSGFSLCPVVGFYASDGRLFDD